MRILALVPGGISEQILFFPTLSTLRKQYPHGIIDVLVEPIAKPAYRVCRDVYEVLAFDYDDRNGLADYLNLLGVIRDREYEIAISSQSQWIIGFLEWLNGIPVRIGYQNEPSWFLTHQVPRKTEQYRAWMYHDLLQGLNIHTPCPDIKISLPQEDIAWAEATQKQLDIKDSGYILIYGEINEANPNTYYPTPKWQQIIDNIQEKYPSLPIVLLQLVEDVPWVAQIKEGYPQLKVVQPMDMGKLAALISGANLMICPLSVPMHLGVAVGTYSVILLPQGQATHYLPSQSHSFAAIESKTDKIADISHETIIEQILRG